MLVADVETGGMSVCLHVQNLVEWFLVQICPILSIP